MGANPTMTTGAVSAAPVAVYQTEWTILWIDHAGRAIGRTWTGNTIQRMRADQRQLARRSHRMAVTQACLMLADLAELPRVIGASAPDAQTYTINADELHLVSGFRVVEGHV